MRTWLCLSAVALVGCGEMVDPALDAGRSDAAPIDGGRAPDDGGPPRTDGGDDVDAAPIDGGPSLDAGVPSIDASVPATDGASGGGPVFVVVLGSSTAEGKNLDHPEYGGETTLDSSWVNRYDRHVASTRPGSPMVRNLAVAGYATWSVLPTGTPIPSTFRPMTGFPDPMRNVTYAVSLAPDAILVNFPSNGDLTAGYTVDQIMANLETIRATAAAAGIPIWVTTSNAVNGLTPALVTATRDLNARIVAAFGDHAIDFYTPRANADGTPIAAYSLTDSTPHPNAEGHRLLFEAVVAANVLDAVRP